MAKPKAKRVPTVSKQSSPRRKAAKRFKRKVIKLEPNWQELFDGCALTEDECEAFGIPFRNPS